MAEVKATFDTTTLEGKAKIFNAKSGASHSMKDLADGTVIDAIGILQYQDTIESYGKPQEVTVTTLFASDGEIYASVSDTIAKGADDLIDFVGETGVTDFKVKIVKAKSKAGNEFLNLQLVL